MASVTILSDNGALSGSAGLKTSGGNDGVLQLQTTTSGGTPTTAISISNTQVVTYTNQPTYTGGTANGVLYLNGSKAVTSGTALVFDGANLGVGITSPAVKLHVGGSGTQYIRLETTSGAACDWITTSSDTYFGPRTNTALAFQTNNAERARIDTSGNLLLGSTSTRGSCKLDIRNDNSIALGGNATYYGTIGYSAATGLLSLAAESGGGINFLSGSTERARIDSGGRFLVGQTLANGSFQLEAGNGSSSGGRIGIVCMGRSGGDYPYIGYNFAFTGTSGSYVYAGADYASSFYFYVGGIYSYTANSGSAGAAISYTAGPYLARGGTSWTNASDERLKNITGDIEDGLAKVCALRAATYTWKSDEQNTPQVGLIAQNVLTVLPEAVVVPEEEFNGKAETAMGVNYDRLIPVLVAAIKELKAEIDVLKGQA